jgi:gliding motility-associated lipoprotein GldD
MLIRNLLIIICITSLLVGCSDGDIQTPKPRGYAKINFPEKKYVKYNEGCKFKFDIPVYSNVTMDENADAQPCWININYPQFNGRLHLSYHDIYKSPKKLIELTEDSRGFVFKHTQKATAIDEIEVYDPKRNMYGVIYLLDGNVASSLQFYITDSTHHFLRGALYFRSEPKLDSIQPVLNFIKTDMEKLIETAQWKK